MLFISYKNLFQYLDNSSLVVTWVDHTPSYIHKNEKEPIDGSSTMLINKHQNGENPSLMATVKKSKIVHTSYAHWNAEGSFFRKFE